MAPLGPLSTPDVKRRRKSGLSSSSSRQMTTSSLENILASDIGLMDMIEMNYDQFRSPVAQNLESRTPKPGLESERRQSFNQAETHNSHSRQPEASAGVNSSMPIQRGGRSMEVISLLDDDDTEEAHKKDGTYPLAEPQQKIPLERSTERPATIQRQTQLVASQATESRYGELGGDIFGDFGTPVLARSPKAVALEGQLSGMRQDLVHQQQRLFQMESGRGGQSKNRSRLERTLSLSSAHNGKVPESNPQSFDEEPQSKYVPNQVAPVMKSSMPMAGPTTGEQQLIIALTQLTTEKTYLEKRLLRVNADYQSQGSKIAVIQRENSNLKKELEKYRSTTTSLKTQATSLGQLVSGIGTDFTELNRRASIISGGVKDCEQEGKELRVEIQRARGHLVKVEDRVGKWGDSIILMKEMEVEKERGELPCRSFLSNLEC